MRFAVPYRLGYPVLPDSFTSAAGENFSYSPNTPDAIIMQVLGQNQQHLPVDLAAKWAAVQAASSPAVTAGGQPISTQTAAPVTLAWTVYVAPGVWRCQMSDGSSHYCDQNAQPISYTPPVATPAVTPAQSLPTAAVVPSSANSLDDFPRNVALPVPGFSPGGVVSAVTPAGQAVSTTSGVAQPPPAVASGFDFSSITTLLKGSMFGGIPNWILAAGAGLLLFGGDSKPSRARR